MAAGSPPKSIEIGRVGKAHGLRGEVKVHLYWEGGETLRSGLSVSLTRGNESKRAIVHSVKSAGKLRIVSFAGVLDRDAAEGLTGAALTVERDRLPPLDAGEYYLCDLVGARVETPAGPLGTVVDVEVHPGADAMVIELTDGRRALQVLGAPSVELVDTANGVVRLSSLDGLIGDDFLE